MDGTDGGEEDIGKPSNISPYRKESLILLKQILLRQTIKTILHFTGETNGELHRYLHTYIADNPLKLDGVTDPDVWLSELAAAPLTKVQHPGRASFVSISAQEAATSERDVSPRDLAERIIRLMDGISQEMSDDLLNMKGKHQERIMKKAITKAFNLNVTEHPMDPEPPE